MAEEMPVRPDSDSSRPSRWVLFLQGIGDVLLVLVAGVPFIPLLEIRAGTPAPLVFWLFTILASAAGAGVAVFRISRGRRAGVPLLSPADRPRKGWLRWLLLALVIVVALTGAQEWLSRVLHLEQDVMDRILRVLLTSGWPLVIAGIALVLVAPVLEELLFRGCVFGRFQAYGYWVSGAAISALVFSVLHGVLSLLPFYFGVGIILAWLCHRTRSLWPSMALHSLNNGAAFLIFVITARR